ncbi:MAG: hypothetical protein ABR611_03910 [Chthoniobacterales bacterium]
MKTKPIIYSVLNLIGAAAVYRLLISGGWVTHHYDLLDPDVINLVLVIVEPLVVLCVISYWLWQTAFLYRLLFISFIVQLLIDVGFLAFIGFFFFTWKPKMM